MAVGRGQQTHQQGRFFEVQISSGTVEIGAGCVFEAPSHAEIHPVEIAQQQLAFAEAALQLQSHQQLAPFAAERVALAHQFGIEAASQLLGEAAASFQHAASGEVGGKGPQRSDRIDAWMPPEAIVFTAQQCIHQNRREGVELIQFAVTTGIHRIQGLVVAVVDGQGPTHAGQPSAHGDVQGRQRQHQCRTAKPGEQAVAKVSLQAKLQPLAFKTEAERGGIAFAAWRQADAITVL